MSAKTHKIALVVIPPAEAWPPIQTIRAAHDRQLRRWMPHINLLYPLLPQRDLERLRPALQAALAPLAPFEVRLARLRRFHHGHQRYTLWLEPEPAQALRSLHEAVWRAAPGCDDLRRRSGGYTPHLSVGQVQGRDRMHSLSSQLQDRWEPLTFRVRSVNVITRDDPPDDIFRVVDTLDLGEGEGS